MKLLEAADVVLFGGGIILGSAAGAGVFSQLVEIGSLIGRKVGGGDGRAVEPQTLVALFSVGGVPHCLRLVAFGFEEGGRLLVDLVEFFLEVERILCALLFCAFFLRVDFGLCQDGVAFARGFDFGGLLFVLRLRQCVSVERFILLSEFFGLHGVDLVSALAAAATFTATVRACRKELQLLVVVRNFFA